MIFKNHSNSPKLEPLQLLKYNKSVPTRVGIISLVGFTMALLSLLLQFLNYGAISLLNKRQLALVQLSSGESIVAKIVDADERSNEVIKKFISMTFIKMFNWDGLTQNLNDKGEILTKQDTGVEIGKFQKKVTMKAYEASFALSEKQDFRSSFLNQLAQMTPSGVFTGEVQASLIHRFISEPRKIKNGKWEIDLVATLVIFSKVNNAGSGIVFNKTITVEAVTPQEIPNGTSSLAQKIYQTRQSGLEITQILDLKK